MYEYDKLLEYRRQDSETKDIESYIRALLETSHIGDKTRLVVLSCFKDRENTITLEVSGGSSQKGRWEEYLTALALFIRLIRLSFKDIWLVYLENDPANELFYAYFGLRKRE